MIEIPNQLKDKNFRFVPLGKFNIWRKGKSLFKKHIIKSLEEMNKLKEEGWNPCGKAPRESGWQINKNYSFDDEKIKKTLVDGNNYGVLAGKNNLRIIDCDTPEFSDKMLSLFPDTFSVKTGSGGSHIYIKSEYSKNHNFTGNQGEYRADKMLVVGPNSVYPLGNEYKIINNLPIKEYSGEEIKKIISPYIKSESENEEEILKLPDESRSGREMKEIIKLISKGLSEEEVFQEMSLYAKWSQSPLSYRKLTYEKAKDYFEKNGTKPIQEQKDFEIRTLHDIFENGYPEIDWRISNIIPKEGISLIFGKTATFKSWIAMKIGLSCVFGSPFLGNFESKKCNVLYIDEENGMTILPRRLEQLIKGNFSDENKLDLKNFYVANSSGIKLDNPSSTAALNKIIEENSISLVIYDSVVRGMEGDEDQAKDVRHVHENIKRIISKNNGVSFVLLHHATKSGGGISSARGSGDWVNMADVVLTPSINEKKPNFVKLTVEKNRYFDKNSFPGFSILVEDGENGEVFMEFSERTIEGLRAVELCSQDLKEWILKSKDKILATRDINNSMMKKGHKHNTINSSIKKLVNEKILHQIKRGVYEIVNMIQTKE